jgi:hypothetical protein
MVPPRLQGPEPDPNGATRAGGLSLHAGVAIAAIEASAVIANILAHLERIAPQCP